MRKNVLLLLCALLVFALVGCSATAPADQEARQADAAADSETLSLSGAQTPAQDEDAPLRAMILSLSDGEALLITQDTEMPFTSPNTRSSVAWTARRSPWRTSPPATSWTSTATA